MRAPCLRALLVLLAAAPLAICASVQAADAPNTPSTSINPPEAPKRPVVPLPPGTKVLADLAYVPGGGASRTLDLYLPETASSPLPLLVWVHGGGWRGGSKGGDKAFLPLLAHGFAIASINYRLSGEAPFPAQIFDCKSAIRYLRAHATENGIDPERIGVWGGSAGGHLVALLGTSGDVQELEGAEGVTGVSSRVQAVCDWFGPADLLTAYDQGTSDKKNAPNSPLTLLLGGPIDEKQELAKQASPVTYITSDDPPFLIMHGDQDPLVPPAQSQELSEALTKAGISVNLIMIQGAKHGGPLFQTPESLNTVEDFFTRALQKH